MSPISTHAGNMTPSPTRSALLGFLAKVAPGGRYAVYPAGRYTLACLADLPGGCLEAEGRRFVGFIDDDPESSVSCGRPVAPLDEVAASWPIDAILLLRDTHDGRLMRRIDATRASGGLGSIRVITQPVGTLDAMAAHLGTYSPGCVYEAEFVRACRSVEAAAGAARSVDSTLLCTMDGEAFIDSRGDAQGRSTSEYACVMKAFCNLLAEFGFSASLCVQLHDSPGVFHKTPDEVVEVVLDAFGPESVELHGLDHSMPVEGYEVEWLERGLNGLKSRYGVQSRYWAPPGWTLNWRTLAALDRVPQIQAVRGIWSGVNRWHEESVATFRFPYRVGSLWQIPYSYVDWMYMDHRCQPVVGEDVLARHERLAGFAAAGPCLMESVVHPYRLVGADSAKRLATVRTTLESYAAHGVRLAKVADARLAIEPAFCGL